MPLDDTNFTPSPLVSDLMAARRYIDEHGWCQHVSRDGPRVCALGAIFAVTGGQFVVAGGLTRRAAAIDALNRALDYRAISIWNDDPARTKEDVLALYDAAIAPAYAAVPIG